jgi:hypothetical protein
MAGRPGVCLATSGSQPAGAMVNGVAHTTAGR